MTRLFGLALALVALAACGGGGGGGGGGGPTNPTPTIVFTPAGAPGPGSISLQSSGSSGSTLNLEVRATSLDRAYAVAFDLRYPAAVLNYSSSQEGTFFQGTAADADTSMQVAEVDPGHLVIGVTRLGDVGGVDGSGVIMTLRFTLAGGGSGTIRFTDNSLYDPGGNRQPGIDWLGGSVTASSQ